MQCHPITSYCSKVSQRDGQNQVEKTTPGHGYVALWFMTRHPRLVLSHPQAPETFTLPTYPKLWPLFVEFPSVIQLQQQAQDRSSGFHHLNYDLGLAKWTEYNFSGAVLFNMCTNGAKYLIHAKPTCWNRHRINAIHIFRGSNRRCIAPVASYHIWQPVRLISPLLSRIVCSVAIESTLHCQLLWVLAKISEWQHQGLWLIISLLSSPENHLADTLLRRHYS